MWSISVVVVACLHDLENIIGEFVYLFPCLSFQLWLLLVSGQVEMSLMLQVFSHLLIELKWS